MDTKSRRSSYGAPIAAGVALLLLLGVWVRGDWLQAEREQQRHIHRSAHELTRLVEAAFMPLSPRALERISVTFQRMVKRSRPLQGVTLLRGDKRITAGVQPPKAFAPEGDRGELRSGEHLFLWYRLHPHGPDEGPRIQRPHPPRHGPPGLHGPPPRPMFPGDPSDLPVLVLALNPKMPPQVRERAVDDLLRKSALGLLGILAFCGAWSLGIRNRRIQAHLELEQRERAHHEELSLAAAGLAHETKNPLGLIRGISQRLASDSETPAEARQLAEQILDASDRATSRLGEFMNFARLREPVLQATDGRGVIDEVAAVLRYDYEACGVELDLDAESLTIQCDGEMLKQILVNLLLNSLHASKSGDRVSVALGRQRGGVKLRVSDQGCGIPEQLQASVFKPYTTGRANGHGLGLAIVKRIVDRHHWLITLQSEVDRGTSITISGITESDATRNNA